MTNSEEGWPMEITRGERRNIEERMGDRGTTGFSFISNNAPDIGVNPINGLLIVVRTMETQRIKRTGEWGREEQAGIRTGERCGSEKLEEKQGMISRRIGENGGCKRKRDREREMQREIEKERNGERSSVCLNGGP